MSLLKERTRTRISERVTQVQSEQLVETVLSMSFGCIAFLRGFFDDDHFEDQRFVVSHNKKPSGGKNGKYAGSSQKRESIRVKTLVRGKSKEADTLLDWLESPVKDSIEKRYLKGLSLSIILDEEDPDNVFESYTFGISYDNDGFPRLFLDEGKPSQNGIGGLDATRKQIHQLLKRFIIVTQSLPNLPAKRYLSMRLMFNDYCPESYQPKLFIDCSSDKQATLTVPIDLEDEVEFNVCGNFATTHHNFVAGILSLSVLDETDLNDKSLLTKKVDPFDFLSKAEENDDTEKQVSQITHDLKNFVTSKPKAGFQQTQICSSQIATPTPTSPTPCFTAPPETNVSCDCGSSIYLKYSDSIKCADCSKNVHCICYHVSKNEKNFKCIECSNEGITEDLSIIMMLRKIVKYLQDNHRIAFKDVNDACIKLGYHSNDNEHIQLFLKALSVLIFENIINIRNKKYIGHFAFHLNHDGLLVKNTPVPQGRYMLRCYPNKPSMKKYLDPFCGRANESDSLHQVREQLFSQSQLQDGKFDASVLNSSQIARDDHIHSIYEDNEDTSKPSRKKRKVSKSSDLFQI